MHRARLSKWQAQGVDVLSTYRDRNSKRFRHLNWVKKCISLLKFGYRVRDGEGVELRAGSNLEWERNNRSRLTHNYQLTQRKREEEKAGIREGVGFRVIGSESYSANANGSPIDYVSSF